MTSGRANRAASRIDDSPCALRFRATSNAEPRAGHDHQESSPAEVPTALSGSTRPPLGSEDKHGTRPWRAPLTSGEVCCERRSRLGGTPASFGRAAAPYPIPRERTSVRSGRVKANQTPITRIASSASIPTRPIDARASETPATSKIATSCWLFTARDAPGSDRPATRCGRTDVALAKGLGCIHQKRPLLRSRTNDGEYSMRARRATPWLWPLARRRLDPSVGLLPHGPHDRLPSRRGAAGTGVVFVKVAVFGLGYVGAVTAACLARDGHSVVGVDVNPDKVALVARGRSPFVEPGLDELLAAAAAAGRLTATTDASAAASAEISLISVGTPSSPRGEHDTSQVVTVCRQIAAALAASQREHVIVLRSTVPPGTLERCRELFLAEGLDGRIHYAFNPEFLREGSAIARLRQPAVHDHRHRRPGRRGRAARALRRRERAQSSPSRRPWPSSSRAWPTPGTRPRSPSPTRSGVWRRRSASTAARSWTSSCRTPSSTSRRPISCRATRTAVRAFPRTPAASSIQGRERGVAAAAPRVAAGEQPGSDGPGGRGRARRSARGTCWCVDSPSSTAPTTCARARPCHWSSASSARAARCASTTPTCASHIWSGRTSPISANTCPTSRRC